MVLEEIRGKTQEGSDGLSPTTHVTPARGQRARRSTPALRRPLLCIRKNSSFLYIESANKQEF